MKMTQEILGLPIISISTGEEVGKVKNILINGDKGAIDYIVVETGNQIFSAKVIPTDRVLGIGENALTIENEGSISDISKISAAVELVEKDIKVKGTKVLTKKGRLIGEIGDICVDEENCCRITALEHITDVSQGKSRLIPREKVITFGKNLVIVEDDFEGFLIENIDMLKSADGSIDSSMADVQVQPEKKESININVTSPENTASVANQEVAAAVETESNTEPEKQSKNSDSDEAANLFEQRQRQYLIGRRVTKTITDKNGNVIVNEGMIINDEIINEAKKNDKLIELVMNNEG